MQKANGCGCFAKQDTIPELFDTDWVTDWIWDRRRAGDGGVVRGVVGDEVVVVVVVLVVVVVDSVVVVEVGVVLVVVLVVLVEVLVVDLLLRL